MPGGWVGSSATDRKATLPGDWEARRQARFEVDGHRCTEIIQAANGGRFRCTAPATDCDHVGDRADHRIANLRSLCGPHHRKKTSSQGAEGRRALAARRRRDPDEGPHRR